MKIGAVFPQLEIGADPAVVRDWATTVERPGTPTRSPTTTCSARIRRTGPAGPGYTDKSLFHEVFVLFGYLAAITTELELVTGVLVLPQRQTALVAKQAAEIDVLSGGRLRLGVGIGWNQVEYQALGVPFRQRGALLEEQVDVLRKLWAEPVIRYEGRFHEIEEAGLNPLARAGRSRSGSAAVRTPYCGVPGGSATGGCRRSAPDEKPRATGRR